jgi:PAS domain S-box-containing protein
MNTSHLFRQDTVGPYAADQKQPALRNRVAEEEMGCFFANTLGMLCTAGSDGYFKRLSPAWSTTLGWSLEELQSKPFLEFVHPDDHAATLSEMAGLRVGRETILFENRYRCQDGSHKWLQWTANSMPPRDLIFAIARDVTRSRELQKESLEASDREKERLGRELHDGLCQNLAGIAALSTTLSRSLEADSEPAALKTREITKLLNETIGQVREMARGLDPVNLDRIGLAAALEAFVSNVEGLFGISCRFRCHPQFPDPGPKAGLHLYRIAQEAVNNAIHHGRGSCIEINLGLRSEKGLLGIRDDGRGISDEDLKGQGLGIHNMNDRSRLIGGVVKVERRAQKGTSVTCLFPRPSD